MAMLGMMKDVYAKEKPPLIRKSPEAFLITV